MVLDGDGSAAEDSNTTETSSDSELIVRSTTEESESLSTIAVIPGHTAQSQKNRGLVLSTTVKNGAKYPGATRVVAVSRQGFSRYSIAKRSNQSASPPIQSVFYIRPYENETCTNMKDLFKGTKQKDYRVLCI